MTIDTPNPPMIAVHTSSTGRAITILEKTLTFRDGSTAIMYTAIRDSDKAFAHGDTPKEALSALDEEGPQG